MTLSTHKLIDITEDYAFEGALIERALSEIPALVPGPRLAPCVSVGRTACVGKKVGQTFATIRIAVCGGTSAIERAQIWDVVRSVLDDDDLADGNVVVDIAGRWFN